MALARRGQFLEQPAKSPLALSRQQNGQTENERQIEMFPPPPAWPPSNSFFLTTLSGTEAG